MRIVSCKYCEFSINKFKKKSLLHPAPELPTLAISLIGAVKCWCYFSKLTNQRVYQGVVYGNIGSITSRCSGKWARTHPSEIAAGRVWFLLLVSANQVAACRISSGNIIAKIIICHQSGKDECGFWASSGDVSNREFKRFTARGTWKAS